MRHSTRRTISNAAFSLALSLFGAMPQAQADEGGVSLWLPGTFGSLAATPLTPGWSLATVGLQVWDRASGNVAAAREVTLGRFNRTANVNIDLNVNLKANISLLAVVPTYVVEQPVLGGQLSVSVMGVLGRPFVALDGTLTLAGPNGGSITGQGTREDVRTAFGDLYPQVTWRVNHGVHNFMVYGFGDIPVGAYDPSQLSNVGIGHGGIDGGGGYTYFNPATGHEFSAVAGVTYNFKNYLTDYQNGIDFHLDWGASQFISKQVQVGLVGYVYQQLTPDKGQAAFLGDMKSRVLGIGPQVGVIFPVGDLQGYLNLKAYGEFAAENRPSGWNAWVTFVISPPAPGEAKPTKPLVTKY
jgi:hypothetical protein